jgi:glycerol-3-phosphate dehydrogenase
MKTLDSLLKNGVKNGVEGLVILNRDQVLEKEPNINPKVVGALYCHWTGITSPYEYVIALSENAFTNGVVFKLDHEVTDILITDPKSNQSRFLVQTDKEYFVHSRIVVNAAGNMADKISSMVFNFNAGWRE